jgi:hypothetical protein
MPHSKAGSGFLVCGADVRYTAGLSLAGGPNSPIFSLGKTGDDDFVLPSQFLNDEIQQGTDAMETFEARSPFGHIIDATGGAVWITWSVSMAANSGWDDFDGDIYIRGYFIWPLQGGCIPVAGGGQSSIKRLQLSVKPRGGLHSWLRLEIRKVILAWVENIKRAPEVSGYLSVRQIRETLSLKLGGWPDG